MAVKKNLQFRPRSRNLFLLMHEIMLADKTFASALTFFCLLCEFG